ncbi:MAG TPA: TetR/AcrR family transcriptional regulator [Allosphingosinicella sp.]|nr:TetR/AcrR family transcriptional regulator [Allosphingosinicella sp.]
MARPQSPDYDKRRDAIVRAAARLYARRGFQGASVADLAKACKTSKSLIYHYFPSKEDILHEVMASHLDALVAAAVAATRSGGAEERLRALTLAFMRLYVGAQDRHKVLLNELDNLPPARRAEVIAKQRRIIAAVEELIQALRPESGPLALPLTMLFFGMINWTHTWFRAEGRVSAETLADLAVDLMLDGLGGVQAS